jgi:hypothetical protein
MIVIADRRNEIIAAIEAASVTTLPSRRRSFAEFPKWPKGWQAAAASRCSRLG